MMKYFSVLIVVSDQLSKSIVHSSMNLYDSFAVIPYLLNFTYIRNEGIAFGEEACDWSQNRNTALGARPYTEHHDGHGDGVWPCGRPQLAVRSYAQEEWSQVPKSCGWE